MTRNRKQPDARIGLLQQLRRRMAARHATKYRKRVGATGETGQPVEVCEVRAMLTGDGLDLSPEVDIEYASISNADFQTQIDNALEFVDANPDSLDVTFFVNGEEVDRAELRPATDFNAASSSSASIIAAGANAAGASSSLPLDDFATHDPLIKNPDQLSSGRIVNDATANVNDLSMQPEDPSDDETWPIDADYDFTPSETRPDGFVPVIVSPAHPGALDSLDDDAHIDWGTADKGAATQDSNLPDDRPLQPSGPEPIAVTTVIKTDSGILVLHQTSADHEGSVTSPSGLKFVQQFILSQFRELRDSKAKSRLQRVDRITTVQPTAVTSQLDAVFVNSGRLFDELQNDTSSQNVSALAHTVSSAESAGLSDQLTHTPTSRPTANRQRITAPTTLWTGKVRRLFSESAATLFAAQHSATPSAEIRPEVFLADEFVQTGRREYNTGVLNTRLFWSATLRDKKNFDEIQLADIARQAVQPTDSSPDLRNSELSRNLNFLASLAGESAVTIPRRLPDHPPEPTDAKGLAASLLYWINPRGPPDSELPTGFSRQEVILLQHQRLKYSIAPRSPSACFFT